MDFIDAGRGRIALVVGAEKMTAIPTAEVGDILLTACYRTEEADVEGGFAGIFGRIAEDLLPALRRPLARSWRMIAAKNHAQRRRATPSRTCRRISASSSATPSPTRTPTSPARCAAPTARWSPTARPRWCSPTPRPRPASSAPSRFRARRHVNDILAAFAPRSDRLRRRAPRLGRRAGGGRRRRHRPRPGRDPRLLHHGRDDRVRGDGPRRAGRRAGRWSARASPASDGAPAGQPLRRPEGPGPPDRRHRRLACT